MALKKLFGDKVAVASIGSIGIRAFVPALVLFQIVPAALLAAALTLLTLIGARIINVRPIVDSCLRTIAYRIEYMRSKYVCPLGPWSINTDEFISGLPEDVRGNYPLGRVCEYTCPGPPVETIVHVEPPEYAEATETMVRRIIGYPLCPPCYLKIYGIKIRCPKLP